MIVTTRVIVAGASWALALAAVAIARQAAPAAPAQIFRSGVNLIQLDVSVLDKGRHPVHGLSADDFRVLVDGVARPVVAFKAVELPPSPPPSAAPWVRDVTPDVATNTHPGGRAIVIVIDDHTVPSTSSMSATWWMMKERLTAHRVVDELGPDDLAAVVFTENNHTAQGFTNDRQRLLTAIDKAAIFPPMALVSNTGSLGARTSGANDSGVCYCGDCSPRALASIADSLRSLPQQRKIVVYISSGVAILPDISDSCNALRREAQLDTLHKAALANVTIQAIDPKGLSPDFGVDNPYQDYLRTMAESTGGRAVVNNNDPELEVPAVLAESSSYYLLGVEAAGPLEDGRFHAVRISVNRPGLEVRTRSGYCDPTTKERKATAAASATRDLDGAIGGVMPKPDFPMGVAVAPFSGDRQGTLAIVLGATQTVDGVERGTRHTEAVEVVASLFNPETGRFIGSRRSRLTLAWNRTEASTGYYEVLARLPVTSGRYELRLGLTTGDARTASVYTFAEVPDFSREALSLSGLVLNVVPAARVAPRNEFADLMPIVPTARRVFRGTDTVAGFLRVYQKKWTSAAVVTVRITDERNAVRATRTTPLGGPPGRATNGADHRFDVPLAGLAKGEYLLSVDVEAGDRKARRAVRFTME